MYKRQTQQHLNHYNHASVHGPIYADQENATELYIYRLRNNKDLETFAEEVSALYDKKTLLEIYNAATSEPYSFLYVNLRAKNKSDMFYMNFSRKITVED